MAEALRLADRLEGRWALHPDMQEAAAELRRLHELLEAEQTLHQRVIYPELQRLRAQRDALLEALKEVLARGTDQNYVRAKAACDKARAAIKKAQGDD